VGAAGIGLLVILLRKRSVMRFLATPSLSLD
jgi:hypothetical protein